MIIKWFKSLFAKRKETLTVSFQASDFVDNGFFSSKDCPLARAFKRASGHERVYVGTYSVEVYDPNLFSMDIPLKIYEIVGAFTNSDYGVAKKTFELNPNTSLKVILKER